MMLVDGFATGTNKKDERLQHEVIFLSARIKKRH
jgi:hypothetical protein